jgi:hypothetical protein
VRAADVAEGMVFGAWTVLGPATPEYRFVSGAMRRMLDVECWSCRTVYERRADYIIRIGRKRCETCRKAYRSMRQAVAPHAPMSDKKHKVRSERLKLIRQIAEARA